VDLPADVKSYFIKIVANKNEKNGNIHLIMKLKVIKMHLKNKKQQKMEKVKLLIPLILMVTIKKRKN
jgi:hypothetical protein